MGSRNLDRLTSLPDDVLLHILDLIPTKLAVRTSILSKRWRHIWKFVTNLHFDDILSFPNLDSFTKYVDRVLELRKTTHVKSFRLHFSNLWVPNATTLKWIHEAIRLNVSELEIQSVLLELPRPFVCKTLTKLILVCHGKWDDWNITSSIDFPLLKTLGIQVYTNPTLNAFKLIPGCPLLETLSLDVTTSHESDEEYMFNIPTLKHLELSTSRGICVKKVVLNVPNLEDFFVRGRILSHVVMEGFPPLVSVTLCSGTPDHFWVELLYGISGAKSLSLHTLSKYPSNSPMPNFPNLKHLELNANCYFNPLDWLLLHQILENSSELEHLCIQEMLEHPPWNEQFSCWIEPKSVPTCMLKNLRTIKFANFKGRKSYTYFLAYMLGNAEVLKTLTITCYGYALEEEMRLRAELLKLPSASRYCEIHFIGSQSHSTSS